MALTCKVVVEILFSRPRMSKKFLESIVKDLAKRKGDFINQYKATDPGIKCRIYYEDYTVPQVSARDLLPGSGLIKILRRDKKNRKVI